MSSSLFGINLLLLFILFIVGSIIVYYRRAVDWPEYSHDVIRKRKRNYRESKIVFAIIAVMFVVINLVW
jgi:uncharacterized membrane protein YidH (DUF202 family)